MSEPAASRTANLEALRPFGAVAESLWPRLANGIQPGTRRTILFLGTAHRAGTSTVAACTAAGLARNLRAKVVLVELGTGGSTLAPLLGLPEGPGLAELLREGASARNCLRGCEIEGLEFVTAGRGGVQPGSLASARAVQVFEELGAGRDFLLIDAPPIQLHPELNPILMHAREAVLVLVAEETRRESARALLETLRRAGLTVIGSVLNRARSTPFG